MFDFHAYLARLVATNRLAQSHRFRSGTCSGIDGIEDVRHHFSTSPAFILSDDITTAETIQHSGGWRKRRTFTVFILHTFRHDDESDRLAKMNLCREMERQLQSRFLHDQPSLENDLTYLRLDAMPSTEIGRYFGNGLTGLYFMVTLEEPTDLCYNPNEWT